LTDNAESIRLGYGRGMDGTATNDKRSGAGPAHDRATHFKSKTHCRICEQVLTVHEAAQRAVCSRPDCRRQLAVRDFTSREREQYERRCAIARRALPDANAPSVRHGRSAPVVVPVPVMSQRVYRLPVERRRAFLRRLIGALRELWSESDPVSSCASEPSQAVRDDARERLTAAACATCRGSCCQVGADHAFIDVTTLRAQRRREPGVSPAVLLRRYWKRIPDRSYRHSCIFHTDTGCALPRSMRSSICNGHLCRDLQRALESTPDLASRPAWLVAIRDDAARPMRMLFHDSVD
jgi:hypothetical protein